MTTEFLCQYDCALAERLTRAMDVVYDVDQPTPTESLALRGGSAIAIKREDLSKVRSYKWRGAYNKMVQCVRGGDSGPFAATSAGNHAQGVALSASLLGVTATIFMPQTTPALKQQSVAALGGDNVTIQLVGDSYDDAAVAAAAWVGENRATVVPPFDDLDVIAGQGTVGIELMQQRPDLDYVFVPVGGGGLAAGIGFAARATKLRVIGVESAGQDAMRQSLAAGQLLSLQDVDRFCDGTGVKRPGIITFEICQCYLDRVTVVTNEQVCAAIELCWNEKRMIPEPSGALALAGLLQAAANGELEPDDDRCAAIITGANTDFLNLPTIVRGSRMTRDARRFFRFEIDERKGSLIHLLDKFLSTFNIVDFQYGITSEKSAFPVLGLSGNAERFERLHSQLAKANLHFEEVTQSETVLFRVIPFRPDLIADPAFLHIDFPERPGALRDLMRQVSDFAGICYFNYAETGTQEGQALIGFECAEPKRLMSSLDSLHFPYRPIEMDDLLGHH